jgi:hypothetical protein
MVKRSLKVLLVGAALSVLPLSTAHGQSNAAGAISQWIGLGNSLLSEGMSVQQTQHAYQQERHQEQMQDEQQELAQKHCPTGQIAAMLIRADGQRDVVCVSR